MIEWTPGLSFVVDPNEITNWGIKFDDLLAGDPSIPGSLDDTIDAVTLVVDAGAGTGVATEIAHDDTSVAFQTRTVTETMTVTVRVDVLLSGNRWDRSVKFKPKQK